ncbi:Secreted protein [Venustampulla echinocandica]|uniref:Secreted protein n=1 Tax=Venustampulla echinocandica TaxID=2656787 RepID=A0A370TKC9_9HELO|nr:Secreted protein [Venustampulla echinocandica]RDL35979.1 Secreted protein [Venustampulla echinocandica]
MYIATILTLSLSLASAALGAVTPRNAPSKVKINGISLLGSGCPAGTADVQVDATGTLFEATFSTYEIQTGPGTKAVDWRKNCKLTMNMEFDSGFQFTILDTEMKGFDQIPSGATGQCKNVFSFTGFPGSATYSLNLPGPSSGNFNLKTSPGIESWSPCGGQTAILNMNTQCSLAPTHLPALIAVDSISGKLTVKFAVSWRNCPK